MPYLSLVGEAGLRDRLSQVARFFREEKQGVKIVSPPKEIAQVLLARHTWQLPALRGLTEVPVLRPDGTVLTKLGYDKASQLLYTPAKGLRVPPIPETPTRQGA